MTDLLWPIVGAVVGLGFAAVRIYAIRRGVNPAVDERNFVTRSIVGGYLTFVGATVYRLLFMDGEVAALEAILGLLAGIGTWVGAIVERRNTQAAHEKRQAVEAEMARDGAQPSA